MKTSILYSVIDLFSITWISSFSALQVIEVFIRAEDGLCREVVKHLNHIEEQILESMAWKQESILWDRIRDNDNKVPSCEEVGSSLYSITRLMWVSCSNRMVKSGHQQDLLQETLCMPRVELLPTS